MKPELKLGRPVLAGDTEPLIAKGKYLYPRLNGHYILSDKTGEVYRFQHAKPDLTAPPMNGDEVEVSNDAVAYMPQYYRYIGQRDDGLHTVEKNDIESIFRHVRHPQPSKRERVEGYIRGMTERLNGLSPKEIADQIDKIYTEDE